MQKPIMFDAINLALGVAHVSLGVITVGAVIGGVALHPALYALAGLAVVAQVPLLLTRRLLSQPTSRRGVNRKAARITDQQVIALLDSRRPTITASRLASATNSTEEAAAEKLTDMARKGQLRSHVPHDSYEVHYSRWDNELPTNLLE